MIINLVRVMVVFCLEPFRTAIAQSDPQIAAAGCYDLVLIYWPGMIFPEDADPLLSKE